MNVARWLLIGPVHLCAWVDLSLISDFCLSVHGDFGSLHGE